MKAFCPQCQAERQVPFRATREDWFCKLCSRPLVNFQRDRDKPRAQLRRDPDKQLRQRKPTPQRSIADSIRATPRDWSLARAKCDEYADRFEIPCVWATLGGCEGGQSPEACHVIGRDRDAFSPLALDPDVLDAWLLAEEKGKWLVAPARVVPGCTHHHQLFDADKIALLGRLELDEELQAVADSRTVGTMESGISLAARHLDEPGYREARAA